MSYPSSITTAVPYASISDAFPMMAEVMKRVPTMALAPISSARLVMRRRAYSLASASSRAYSSISPPTILCRPAMMSRPMCLARAVLPRTSPATLVI